MDLQVTCVQEWREGGTTLSPLLTRFFNGTEWQRRRQEEKEEGRWDQTDLETGREEEEEEEVIEPRLFGRETT